jgi:hypothetical protein
MKITSRSLSWTQALTFNQEFIGSNKVTAGNVFDEYHILLVVIVIPLVNVVFFVAFAGIVLFKIFKDVKIL